MLPIAEAFRARIKELGWLEGENIVVDVRATSGDYTKLDAEAGKLVAASADVIVRQSFSPKLPIRSANDLSTAWLVPVAMPRALQILNLHSAESGLSYYSNSIPRFRM